MENNNYGSNGGVQAEIINGPVSIYSTLKTIKNLPSILPKFIEKLAELVNQEPILENGDAIGEPYRIEDKIVHNNLIAYKDIIDDYGNYYYICEEALNLIDNNDYNSKKKIMRSISEIYKAKKRILFSEYRDLDKTHIEIIRENSDRIIDMIKEEIIDRLRNCYENENIVEEDIDLCSSIFLCYSFVECKILERPAKNDY